MKGSSWKHQPAAALGVPNDRGRVSWPVGLQVLSPTTENPELLQQFEALLQVAAVVQVHHLDAGDLLDHGFHDRPRRFGQMGPYLFEQVPPLLGRQRLDQLLFGRGQDALEADHEKVIDQVGVDVLGPAAHVFLFKATDPFADGGFDFPLGFHGDLKRVPSPGRCPHGRRACTAREEPGVPGPSADHDSGRGTAIHLLSRFRAVQ
jgi:hypothetical protein